jgi:hypothetical protein
MGEKILRDFGEQPIAAIMAAHSLKPHDLVVSSTEQVTHKMVSRAIKGRRLTVNIRAKILNALNNATGKAYKAKELFNYLK